MEYLGTILIVIFVLIGLFLLLRELNCWYWKINERIDLQKEQNQLLRQILNKSGISTLKSTTSFENSEQSKEVNTESELKKSSIVKTSIGDYNRDHNQKGEAFCIGCRKVDQMENLLYNEKGDKYYHLDCLKEFIL